MKTPFDVLCKIQRYRDAVLQLEHRMQRELSRGNMAEYWQLQGLVEGYKVVIRDFEPLEKNLMV